MKNLAVLLTIIWAMNVAWSQPVPDEAFEYKFDRRAYLPGAGPRVLIDEGHNNLHKKDEGLLPLVKMLVKDGYAVSSNTSLITDDALNAADLYVIVNPLHDSDVGNWVVPNPSAFTGEEMEVLTSWIRMGGSLLLVADHMPYGGAVQELGEKLGVSWNNGFAIREGQHWPPSVFDRANGTLKSSFLTNGKESFERIDQVATFTGSVFKAPEDAQVFLEYDDSHNILMPDTAWRFNEQTVTLNSDGWHQGACFSLGKGKVVVLGEAAMITAQIVNNGFKVGMNSPQATENAQLALNIFHYLSGHEKYVNVNELLDANLREMERAYGEGDMLRVAGFYKDDAVIMGPNGNDQKGRTQINNYWSAVKGMEVDWKLTTIERMEIGDQIHEIGTSELTYKSRGEEVTASTRFYLIWELEGGQYKIKMDFYHAH